MKAHVLVNSSAGSSPERPKVEQTLRAADFSDLHWLNGDDFGQSVAKAVSGGATLMVAAGGDGTVSAVAGALAGSEARLGILPLKTLNHFARDLKIPLELDDAAALLANGEEARVDVAEVNAGRSSTTARSASIR